MGDVVAEQQNGNAREFLIWFKLRRERGYLDGAESRSALLLGSVLFKDGQE
jgi:hypothetical protein